MNTKICKFAFLAFAFVAASSQASVARLTLTGTAGDWITLGQSVDNIYSSEDPLNYHHLAYASNVGTGAAPASDYAYFSFLKAPWLVADDLYSTLIFSTQQLGVPMATGILYESAERGTFASAGHPGLDVSYGHRGCNTLTGSFTINELSLANSQINRFSASFNQSCDGGALMKGTFFYDANLTSLPSEVSEPSTLALLGLSFLVLGVARRRRQIPQQA